MIKVLRGCILKLSLHSVNSVPILYRTGNMQSAILLSFVVSSSIPPCRLQSTLPQMPCYIIPYIQGDPFKMSQTSGVAPPKFAMSLGRHREIHGYFFSSIGSVLNEICNIKDEKRYITPAPPQFEFFLIFTGRGCCNASPPTPITNFE